ncbi:MAG: hypothetical protein RIC55_11055 [Pirellulaceae bacterium]
MSRLPGILRLLLLPVAVVVLLPMLPVVLLMHLVKLLDEACSSPTSPAGRDAACVEACPPTPVSLSRKRIGVAPLRDDREHEQVTASTRPRHAPHHEPAFGDLATLTM